MYQQFTLLIFVFCSSVAAQDLTILSTSPIYKLNPFWLEQPEAWQILKHQYESLAHETPQGKIKPQLAQKWTISKNKKVFHFYLKPNLRWQDGKPLTAKDVKFSYHLLFEDKYKAHMWRPSFKNIKKVNVVSKLVVKFEMTRGNYLDFLNIATYLRIFPKHFYEKLAANQRGKKFLGSGPYQITRVQKGKSIELSKNPYWWGVHKTNYNKLNYFFIGDKRLAPSLIIKNSPSVFLLDGLAPKKRPKNLQLITHKKKHSSRLIQIQINLKDKILSSKKVRLALNHLWNRKLIQSKYFKNNYSLASSPWASYSIFNDKKQKTFSYNPRKARSLLKGKKFKLTIAYSETELEPLLSFYQQDAKAVGIEVHLQKMNPVQQWKLTQQGQLQAWAISLSNNHKILSSLYKSQAVFNTVGYNDSKLNILLTQLDKEFTFKKRLALQKKIFARITSLVPEIYGFETQYKNYLTSGSVKIPDFL